LNQRQHDVIDYLHEENRVLREQLGGKGLRFNDDQRRRLAVRAKKLGWRMLHEVSTIVTPATLWPGTAGWSLKSTMAARNEAWAVPTPAMRFRS
jgi:hypothetical protein